MNETKEKNRTNSESHFTFFFSFLSLCVPFLGRSLDRIPRVFYSEGTEDQTEAENGSNVEHKEHGCSLESILNVGNPSTEGHDQQRSHNHWKVRTDEQPKKKKKKRKLQVKAKRKTREIHKVAMTSPSRTNCIRAEG
jgi:hypothetical protein